MPVGVMAEHKPSPAAGDLLSEVPRLEVALYHLLQSLVVVEGQVLSVSEQALQAVLDSVGHEQAPAGQRLEDPHVDVPGQRAVEDDLGAGQQAGHVTQVDAPDLLQPEAAAEAIEEEAAAVERANVTHEHEIEV